MNEIQFESVQILTENTSGGRFSSRGMPEKLFCQINFELSHCKTKINVKPSGFGRSMAYLDFDARLLLYLN
jgi:hypothetical protein